MIVDIPICVMMSDGQDDVFSLVFVILPLRHNGVVRCLLRAVIFRFLTLHSTAHTYSCTYYSHTIHTYIRTHTHSYI